jgi:phage tail-like protein
MALTAWTRSPGTRQARVRPVNFIPPSGFFAFVIGSDLPGQVEQLATGSYHQVWQEGTHAGAKIIRFRGKLRPPSSLPDDSGYLASMLLNGTKVMSQQLVPGWTRNLADWAINVSQLSSSDTIAWQVEVTGSPSTQYELELPAFYVDAIVLDDTATGISLVNRIPEPDETQVPLDASIRVEFMDVTGTGVDLASTKVYVRGTLAFDGGVFQTGFSGSYSTPQTDTLRVEVQPDDPYEGEELITVRALASVTGGAYSVDQTYTFTALDVAAPRLVSATPQDQKVIRLSFSEPVVEGDGTDSNDATNPANYTFERLSVPAVTLRAVSVEAVTPTSVDVTVQWPMTPGAQYRVTGANLEDEHENAIAAPYDNALFNGYQPPVPAGRRFSLWLLMPARIRQEDQEGTGDLKRFLDALQEPIDLMMYEIDRFLDFLDPQATPDAWVDIMLSDVGNPFDIDMTYEKKRKLLHVFRAAMLLSGSDPGIVNLVRFIMDLDIEVVPYDSIGMSLGESLLGEDWTLGASGRFLRYAFDVISPRVLSAEERSTLRKLVNYIQAGWEHFVNLKEPGDGVVGTVDHLELGISQLGETWILH